MCRVDGPSTRRTEEWGWGSEMHTQAQPLPWGTSRASNRTGVHSTVGQPLLLAPCSCLTPDLGIVLWRLISQDGLPPGVIVEGSWLQRAHLLSTRVGAAGLDLVHALLVTGHLTH